MLKTNSKKAKENLKKYIMDYSEDVFTDEIDYCQENGEKFTLKIDSYADRCKMLYQRFLEEYCHPWNLKQYKTYQNCFEQWTRGLPCNGLFCYWYNREAKEDLKMILEETETEANRFTEEQAEILLTNLIYREILKNKEA